MENKTILAVAGVGLVTLGSIAGGLGVDMITSEDIELLKEDIAIKEAELLNTKNELSNLRENPIIKEIPVEVPVEVPVEKIVEKEVKVDNGNLDKVLEHIYDNDGSIEYITDNLDDDELD